MGKRKQQKRKINISSSSSIGEAPTHKLYKQGGSSGDWESVTSCNVSDILKQANTVLFHDDSVFDDSSNTSLKPYLSKSSPLNQSAEKENMAAKTVTCNKSHTGE